MQGKLIVIDGTDGSGKGTQTRRLVKRLEQEGVNVKTVSFPTYGTESCKGVEAYLNGEFGSAEYVGPHFASMLYAFNRAKEMDAITKELAKGTHVIVNRYVSANAGHQGGKIADEDERERFLNWLFHLEFSVFKIPRPDLTILLLMPPALGRYFVTKKHEDERKYLKDKTHDIHEEDEQHMQNAMDAFAYTARKYPDWHVIESVKDGVDVDDPTLKPEAKVRTLDEIHEELYAHIRNVIK